MGILEFCYWGEILYAQVRISHCTKEVRVKELCKAGVNCVHITFHMPSTTVKLSRVGWVEVTVDVEA